MERQRFEELNAALSSALRAKLDRIKRYLSQNMASVMVGAGFSLNAVSMNPYSKMRSWNELTSSFWDLLYPGREKDFDFITPMHLASLVEAHSGRNELDHQIASSLPDEDLTPGELHLSLMRLPWKDVFTTNYDRLLERAALHVDRKYNIVTNKSSLLYKISPRIIKLHGSFPDITPFIMTEDDFRTYPEKYPEFVNTVRQALIENVFCLIGFSGEDPNFLSWLGWLRDVMGNLMSPAYLIDYKEDSHDADIKLNNFRRIDVINLAEISGIKGRKEALNFFFEYLSDNSDNTKEWKASLEHRIYDRKSLLDITSDMKAIRESYPGWLFLPERYYEQFNDLEEEFPYLEDKINMLKGSELIDYLYEVNWRLSISCTPCAVKWFAESIEKLSFDEDETDSEKILSLKLTLLSIHRMMLETKTFEKLEAELLNYFSFHESDMIGRFQYERCLYRTVTTQFEELKKILNSWRVSDTDYQGLLWKASIWNMIGESGKSTSLLETISQNVNTALLKANDNYAYLISCAHIANIILRYCVPKVDISTADLRTEDSLDFNRLLDKVKLKTEKRNRRTGIYDTHSYLLKEINTVWSSAGRGFFKDYINSYRILALIERVGYPLQINGRTIGNSTLLTALRTMTRYESALVVSTIVKSRGGRWMLNDVFTRELMGYIKAEEADCYYNLWFEECKRTILNSSSDSYVKDLVCTTILPMLYRMSVKLNQHKILELFKIAFKMFGEKGSNYDSKYIKLLFSCMDAENTTAALAIVYKTPVTYTDIAHEYYFYLPDKGYISLEITEQITKLLAESLISNDDKKSKASYARIMKLFEHRGTEWMNDTVENALLSWLLEGKITDDKRKVFKYLNDLEKFKEVPFMQIVDRDVESLLNYPFDKSNYKNALFIFRDMVYSLSINAQFISSKMDDVLEKVRQFLQTYEKEILRIDDRDIMGDYDFCDFFFKILTSFVENSNFDRTNIKKLQKFLHQIEKFHSTYSLSYLRSIVMVSKPIYSIPDTFVADLGDQLFHESRMWRADAFKALKIIAKNGVDISMPISKTYHYIELSQSESLYEYIDFLSDLAMQSNLTYSDELDHAIRRLLEKVKGNGLSENAKMDITYCAISLLKQFPKKGKSLKLYNSWKKYISDTEIFNDVKIALEAK